MRIIRRVVPIAALSGAAVAVAFYFLSLAIGTFPVWLLMFYLILCPPGMLFLATAACEPFDSCTLQTLLAVSTANGILYAVGAIVAYTAISWARRRKSARRGGAA